MTPLILSDPLSNYLIRVAHARQGPSDRLSCHTVPCPPPHSRHFPPLPLGLSCCAPALDRHRTGILKIFATGARGFVLGHRSAEAAQQRVISGRHAREPWRQHSHSRSEILPRLVSRALVAASRLTGPGVHARRAPARMRYHLATLPGLFALGGGGSAYCNADWSLLGTHGLSWRPSPRLACSPPAPSPPYSHLIR